MKKLKKLFMIIFGSILLLLLIVVCLGFGAHFYGANYKSKSLDKVEVNHEDMITVKAVDRGLYDKNGNLIQLKGINFGNWLIQEGWMSCNSLGVTLDENGNFASVNSDGIVEGYLEVYQEELDNALLNNPNLTEKQVEELWDVYYKAYCQEEDFKNIKEIGFNMIRLPMYYRNFMEGPDDNLVMRDDAFELVDWFLSMAMKYDLYVILDLHGVVGGQNGFEHSGTRKIDFWDNEKYIESMCELWQNIARHYKEERADLAYTIAAYDLINEPAGATSSTGKKQWKVMDRLYDAIREVDKDHVIAFEGCWFFNTLPNPKKYGWENVLYEYHLYNWNRPLVSNDMFYALQWLTLSVSDYNVPKYIGEFTFFDEKKEWIKWLNQYDQMGFSFSMWNYKTISVGWWDSSWGLYVNKMNLFEEKLKLDVRTATYDEIYAVWSKEGTSESYTSTGILMESVNAYFEQFK